MSLDLADAREIRNAIQELGLGIYDSIAEHPEVLYSTAELEALLRRELAGEVFTGPIRTRSKIAKEAVCVALGYPAPTSFRRVKPRIPGQDLDVYVQQHDNLQVWNEELSPTRRYALIRVDSAGDVTGVKVVEGTYLVHLDKTGTLTSKYQAKRRGSVSSSRLVSPYDTDCLQDELSPADFVHPDSLRAQKPVAPPISGQVLSVGELYGRLLGLIGQEFAYSSSERLRGEGLHRLVCSELGLGSYADTGKFPDILCQALEVKLQTAATVDLGLVTPDSEDLAVTLSPRLRHCDVRYLVAYATHDTRTVRIEHIVVATGATFFEEFQPFGGLVQNRKLQLRLPSGFFETE